MSTEIIKKYTCDNEANSSCVKKLSSLSLRRLILPTNIKLTRSNLVRSYTLELPREDSDSYSQLNTQLLINELRAVRADFSKLSGSDLIFDKISPDNVMIADNKIFLYDYTKLMLASDIDYARTYNNVKLN